MIPSPTPTTVYVTRTKTKNPKSSTSTPTSTAASDIQCPGINGTTFTPSITSNSTETVETKSFLLLCGLDYGKGEATDIGNVKVMSLNECAEACAKKKKCTGAGWGVLAGDKGPEHKCWMKTDLTRSHNATGEWGFAKLIE
ncbi:hypothetical protein B0T16DRAFT_333882 [Cercophora newfieldiana]|uniref:Apple domain-containing protein n=1 Tax=Cercophora newfieldiana TaxID=92897 RepID=A0AA39XUZ0_9PEZI|nr:hypothetical protein B0T16DRAFT_333882 [Cercophora newfieldiana]